MCPYSWDHLFFGLLPFRRFLSDLSQIFTQGSPPPKVYVYQIWAAGAQPDFSY